MSWLVVEMDRLVHMRLGLNMMRGKNIMGCLILTKYINMIMQSTTFMRLDML